MRHIISHATRSIVLILAVLCVSAGLVRAQPQPQPYDSAVDNAPIRSRPPRSQISPACLNSINPLNPSTFGAPQGFQNFLRDCLAQQPICPEPGGAWPPLVRLEAATTRLANAERDALVGGMDQARQAIAGPHYDMTQSGEGVRYMTTVLGRQLTNLGYGYLSANYAATIRSIVTRTPLKLPKPVFSWSPSGGGSAGFKVSANVIPPAEVQPPQFLRTTPRPVYLQQAADSCGYACLRMMIDTIAREDAPEEFLRGQIVPFLPECHADGSFVGKSYITWLEHALQKLGIKATLFGNQSMTTLEQATSTGYPAMVHTGPLKDGHYIVVDSIVRDRQQNLYVYGRDPFNLALMDPMSRNSLEQAGKRNDFIMSGFDFQQIWSGQAIFTHP